MKANMTLPVDIQTTCCNMLIREGVRKDVYSATIRFQGRIIAESTFACNFYTEKAAIASAKKNLRETMKIFND